MKSNSLFACENVFPSPSVIFTSSLSELCLLRIFLSRTFTFYESLLQEPEVELEENATELFGAILYSRDAMEIIDNEVEEQCIDALGIPGEGFTFYGGHEMEDYFMEKILLDCVDDVPFSFIFATERFGEQVDEQEEFQNP